ncbi:MAG: hypothetical protein OEY38_18480 [Gammaproteobacteria bacterium]|nr:hypothetical protein [Gammaproteobacteria bacterium]
MRQSLFIILLVFIMASSASAGEVEINYVEFKKHNQSWTVRVKLYHSDAGWDHYADGWRIIDEKGNVLGERVLAHPHVDEQPFTRSLSGVSIPANITIVYVTAHDNVHGWAVEKVRVDLTQQDGPRYRVVRR